MFLEDSDVIIKMAILLLSTHKVKSSLVGLVSDKVELIYNYRPVNLYE